MKKTLLLLILLSYPLTACSTIEQAMWESDVKKVAQVQNNIQQTEKAKQQVIPKYYEESSGIKRYPIKYAKKNDKGLMADPDGNIITGIVFSEKDNNQHIEIEYNKGVATDINVFEKDILIARSEMINDEMDGKFIGYYENGNKRLELTKINGKTEGIETGYYRSGKVEYKINYTDGVKNGVYTSYYDNGNKYVENTYIKGLRQGKEIIYREDGTLFITGQYKNDDMVSGICELNKKAFTKTQITTWNSGESVTCQTPLEEKLSTAINARDIYKEFSTNEASGNIKYRGKTIMVTGTIDIIMTDIADRPIVSLYIGEYELSSVNFIFTKAEMAKIAKLKKGQRIYLQGKCEGMTLRNLYFNDSQIIYEEK